jgi:hypothetical protein
VEAEHSERVWVFADVGAMKLPGPDRCGNADLSRFDDDDSVVPIQKIHQPALGSVGDERLELLRLLVFDAQQA